MKRLRKHNVSNRTPILCALLLFVTGIANLIIRNFQVCIVELVFSVIMTVLHFVFEKKKARELKEILSIVTAETGNMANEVLSRFPLPMIVSGIEGDIMWYNDMASVLLGRTDLYSASLPKLLPELKWTELLKSTDGINVDIVHNERHYKVLGNIIKRNDDVLNGENYSLLLYFDDYTDEVLIKNSYENEKIDVAIITIDNYDDVFQTMDDAMGQNALIEINSIVSKWVAESNGLLKKTDSDKYLVFFEHQYLDDYIKNKFDILEKVREIGEEIKHSITISIGIGTGGHLNENENAARNSVEMVWARGGDQVAIKSDGQYKFFGGVAVDYEKSTRVKTRVFSKGLKELIMQADKVLFIGHSQADYDCFGAAVGLSRAVRILNKKSYIILDSSPAIKPILDEMQKHSEYDGMIISPNNALEIAGEETLLVVLDTHRPSILPVPEILDKVNKIVLIDHHRRGTEFIENASLTYHEPYASSACEMATEVLQYIDDSKSLSTFEAKALYLGILMDTKNFVTKTGVRTFEAASYLKRYGVNTMEAKKVLNLDFDEYVVRMDIIRQAEIWNTDIAVSFCAETFNNMRAVSSQAADEMLNISGINAAVVVYQGDSEVYFSARSFGDINVQLIMEKLGGGGHMTVAGCQIKNISMTDARNLLKDAIKEYIEEIKN